MKKQLHLTNIEMARCLLPQSDETYGGIARKAALVLSSSNPALDHPRPVMPNVQYIGGHLSSPTKPLPQVKIYKLVN